MGILFKRGDFRTRYLNPTITKIRDAGLIEQFMNKWRPYKGLKDKVKITEEALVMEHLVLPLGIWSGGFTLALILFAGEKLGKIKYVVNRANLLNLC